MLFGRHMAILGTTGGGKSYTLTRLVEEVAKHRSKTILFDPSGEFGAIESGALHVYFGNHPAPQPNMVEVVMPYFELTENDLFAVFKPSGEAQAPKMRQAIKSLKLAKLVPEIALDGYVVKANRTKQYYEAAYLEWINKVESQNADFDITKLVRQIQNECVLPNRSSVETTSWGDINQIENSLCVTLINRVQDIITSENLSPIFQPDGKRPIFEVIETFLESNEHRVLVISMQYLSFEHNAREIVSNATGRCLMAMARAERFRELPVLVCIDEAHQFLKEKMESNSEYSMDSFALIAKEGRKYGLHICIATQRPRDLPESVLSQVGSLIVHRLINDKDRGIIERACGEANASALSSLPILTQGQAVLLGADFPVPLVVKVQMPIKKPNARSADFQSHWAWPAEEDEHTAKPQTQVIYL
jgi:DNA helicase HerA-like ATPase